MIMMMMLVSLFCNKIPCAASHMHHSRSQIAEGLGLFYVLLKLSVCLGDFRHAYIYIFCAQFGLW